MADENSKKNNSTSEAPAPAGTGGGEPSQGGRPARRRLPVWAKALGWGLFGVMSTVVVSVATLTAVPQLQHKIIMLGAEAVPGLKIDAIDGHIFHPTVRGIHYESPGISVDIETVQWSLDWRELPAKLVKLSTLSVKGVRAKVDTALIPPSAEEDSTPMGRLDLPVSFVLENGTLDDIRADVDGNNIALGHFESALELAGDTLTVSRLKSRSLTVSLAGAPAGEAVSSEAQETASDKDAQTEPKTGADKEPAAGRVTSPENAAAEKPAAEGTARTAGNGFSKTRSLLEEVKARLEKPLLTANMIPSLSTLPLDVKLKEVELLQTELNTGAEALPVLEHLTLIGSVAADGVHVPHIAAALSEGSRLLGSADWKAAKKHPVRVSLWVKPGELLSGNLSGELEPLSSLSSLSLEVGGELLGTLKASLEGRGEKPFDLTLEASPAQKGLPLKAEAHAALVSAGAGLPAAENLHLVVMGDFARGVSPDTVKALARGEEPPEAASAQNTGTAGSALPGIALNLTGTVIPANVPGQERLAPMRLNIEAESTLTHLTLKNSGLQNKSGTAVIEADVDWAEKLKGSASLALVSFNISHLLAQVPVKLGGQAKINMTSASEDVLHSWSAELTGARFTGELLNLPSSARNRRVQMQMTASANHRNEFALDVSEMRWGQNTLEVKAKAKMNGDRLNADGVSSLNLVALEEFSPMIKGSLTGRLDFGGSFGGSALNPVISADLKSGGISVLDADGALVAKLNALTLAGSFGRAGTTPLTLRLNKLVVGETDEESDPMRFSEVTLSAAGTLPRHRLSAQVKGGPAPLSAEIEGGLNSAMSAWRGTLSKVLVNTPIGDWGTENVRIDADFARQSAVIAAHCWQSAFAKGHTPNEVCLAEKATAGTRGKAKVELKNFDLASLKPVLGPDLTLKGIFTGEALLNWDASRKGTLPGVTLNLVNNGIEAVRATDNGPVSVRFSALTLQAKTGAQSVQANLSLTPENNGRLNAELMLSDINRSKKFGGHIRLEKLTLGPLSQLFSTGETVHGSVAADIRLGGSLASPELFGELRVEDADVKNGLVPLNIEPSDITLTFNGQRSTLNGVIRSSDGEFAIDGDADWTDMRDPRARVHVLTRRDGRDETIGLTIPPYADLNMGADVTVMASNAGIDVTGEVVIPTGNITIRELPDSAIQPSSDLVMLKRDLTPVRSQSEGLPIRSSLKITIGPRVRVDAFNLKARLSGELALRQGKQGLGLNGSIRLHNGNFYAYGQALMITRGEILFSGPLDNPYLNLEAIRDPEATEDSVTAGLRVTGSASQPKVAIFSNPAMSQEEALSYLLRGQGLGSSSSDGQAVATALLGMGLSQTSSIVGEIGNAFGIRDLQVTSEGVGVKTKVVVKGNLLPRLQLKYGVGVFDSLATFTLRYRLLPRLYLQGVWGEDTTLDLLYRWEFN